MQEISTVIVLAAALAGPLLVQDIGPYFYRSGNAWAHTRHEITFVRKDEGYVVKECAQPVVSRNIVGQRLCWDSPVDDVTSDESSLKFRAGGKTYVIDASTMTLLLRERGRRRPKTVEPGRQPWSKTPFAD